MNKFIAILAFLATLAGSAWAATETVTLSVPDMYCSACPLTVKAALTRVEGVTKVEASLEKKEAVVTFDDAKTSIAALTKATANAGYPSTVRHLEASKR
jgi:mercuric ion binding protein